MHAPAAAMHPLLLAALGITPAHLAGRALVAHAEASELVLAERNAAGREFLLTPATAAAWTAMKHAAAQDGLVLSLVSAFRSIERQAEIIRAKLAAGCRLDDILAASAPPGFSEHHTGRAIDIGTPESEALEESFEHTPAFAWLQRNAGAFDFALSYPRGNPEGFVYEPWHWCLRQQVIGQQASA